MSIETITTPTLDQVRGAYHRTGLKPGAVDVRKDREGNWCGCGLHALYLDTIGVRGEITDDEARRAEIAYYTFAATALFNERENPDGAAFDWACGFDDGVAGRKSRHKGEVRAEGHTIGTAIRKEFLNG